MRIAFLSQNTVVPLDNGARIRNYHLLRAMASRHEVHVLLTEAARPEDRHLLDEVGIAVHHVAKTRSRYVTYIAWLLRGVPLAVAVQVNPNLTAWVRDSGVDVVVCGGSARAVGLRQGGWSGPVVIDTHNLEHVRLPRLARSQTTAIRRLRGLLRVLGINRLERGVFRDSTVVVCSEPEAAQLAGWRTRRVAVVRNGVDLSRFPQPSSPLGPPTVIFTGDLSYAPNVEAARFLAGSLAPALLRTRPDLRLIVAGRGASSELRMMLEAAHVDVQSPVARMEDVLAEAHVMVVPLTSGGGTRLKIIEAFAAGVPVVSTSIGAEGIDGVPGKHILIADGEADITAAAMRVLDEPELRNNLARNARSLAEERFDWERLGSLFVDLVEEAATGPRGSDRSSPRAVGP